MSLWKRLQSLLIIFHFQRTKTETIQKEWHSVPAGYQQADADPKDAGMTALKRIWENTETRLLDENQEPTFNVNFYVLGKDGRHAGVAFYGISSNGNQRSYAVCDANGGRHEPIEGLIR